MAKSLGVLVQKNFSLSRKRSAPSSHGLFCDLPEKLYVHPALIIRSQSVSVLTPPNCRGSVTVHSVASILPERNQWPSPRCRLANPERKGLTTVPKAK